MFEGVDELIAQQIILNEYFMKAMDAVCDKKIKISDIVAHQLALAITEVSQLRIGIQRLRMTIPNGWHIAWLGMDDGMYTCQLRRHDDLDYKSDISFVSRRAYTMDGAYEEAVDVILKEYGELK